MNESELIKIETTELGARSVYYCNLNHHEYLDQVLTFDEGKTWISVEIDEKTQHFRTVIVTNNDTVNIRRIALVIRRRFQ